MFNNYIINSKFSEKHVSLHKLDDGNINPIGSGVFIKKAIKKYGRENFIKEILQECETKEELLEAERYWIKYFNAVKDKNYYNISRSCKGE